MNLMEKFEALYEQMRKSADVPDMMVFGHTAKKMFERIAKQHPAIAEEWLAMLSPIRYHNYLSEEEAEHIVDGFVSQNGDIGPHWDRRTFEQAVSRLGGKLDDMPHYNSCALWVTANMIYSDHAKSIAEDMGLPTEMSVPVERMAKSCYRKAVEKLTDPDRPRFVRAYFDLE